MAKPGEHHDQPGKAGDDTNQKQRQHDGAPHQHGRQIVPHQRPACAHRRQRIDTAVEHQRDGEGRHRERESREQAAHERADDQHAPPFRCGEQHLCDVIDARENLHAEEQGIDDDGCAQPQQHQPAKQRAGEQKLAARDRIGDQHAPERNRAFFFDRLALGIKPDGERRRKNQKTGQRRKQRIVPAQQHKAKNDRERKQEHERAIRKAWQRIGGEIAPAHAEPRQRAAGRQTAVIGNVPWQRRYDGGKRCHRRLPFQQAELAAL